VTVIAPTSIHQHLTRLSAHWSIDGHFESTDAYWDAIDAGHASGGSDIVLLWADCSGVSTDIPGTAVSLSMYARVWVFTTVGNVDQTKQDLRVYEGELNMPGTADTIAVAAISESTLDATLRRELRELVDFAPEPQAPESAPNNGEDSGPRRPRLSNFEPAVSEAATTAGGNESYAQSSIYSEDVIRTATTEFTKSPQARPGQVTIACMSSKGGSGKSTTALSLAGMIAQSSKKAGTPKKVVVVDLDVRDGQVGSLIGQYLPTAVSIRVQPTWDAETITANLVHDNRLGIDALLAPVRPRNAEDVGPDFYRQVIQTLQTTHDVVILDCSVSYLDPLLGMAFSLTDAILFVTTLATTSIQGMARALGEMFAPPQEGGLGVEPAKVGIVANQVMSNVGITKDQVFSAALGSQIVGTIPAAFIDVMVATNSTRLDKLLTHPELGPAYFKLAKRCLPNVDLASLT